jgi:hypothetical protein
VKENASAGRSRSFRDPFDLVGELCKINNESWT